MNSKGKLLLADDEPDFTEFVKWQLENLSYTVHTASSGAEALDILSTGEPVDILLADIRMPGMDGIELIRRAIELCPDLQCIVMTGHGGIETAVEAMKLGAINYLRKPVGVDELDMAIQKGMEKLGLILDVREKQERLEAANARLREKQEQLENANKELSKLRVQLEEALEKETEGRKQAEDELREVRVRELLVEVLTLSLRYWKQATQKTKIELAEESKIWTASLDSGGTYRTRTLDRYLRINTLPPNPRSGDVLDTAYFVLSNCLGQPGMKEKLEDKIARLEKMLLG
ncbi:response regulator [Desulfococcaceae bacterium HSG8]|nr:response regulator [Desulfococcaceae bacterium HSG8]